MLPICLLNQIGCCLFTYLLICGIPQEYRISMNMFDCNDNRVHIIRNTPLHILLRLLKSCFFTEYHKIWMILKPMFPEIKIISYYASKLQRIWCAKLIKRCTSEHVTRSIVCNTFISKLFTVITNFRDQKRNKYVGVEVYVNDLSFQATDMFVTFGKFSKMP